MHEAEVWPIQTNSAHPKRFHCRAITPAEKGPTQGAAERSNAGKTQQHGEDQAHQEHLRTMGQSSSPLPADPRHSSTHGHDAVPLEPQCSSRHQPLSAVLLSGMQCRTHPCRQTQAGKLVLNHTKIASLGNLCSTSYFLGQTHQSMSASHCQKSTVL